MRLTVGVVDYGMGNLHSVEKALSRRKARVKVTDSKNQLGNCDVLVLPGVGSFGAAMKTLARKKLDDYIYKWIEAGKPYIGICLGYQLLFDKSEESPRVPGLSVFKGRVVRFRPAHFKKSKGTIPHMGWNQATSVNKRKTPYLRGISPADSFYFVHSFFPVPAQKSLQLTHTMYGKPFCSSIATDRLFASQFHPEKSGDVGQRLLKNILNQFKEN